MNVGIPNTNTVHTRERRRAARSECAAWLSLVITNAHYCLAMRPRNVHIQRTKIRTIPVRTISIELISNTYCQRNFLVLAYIANVCQKFNFQSYISSASIAEDFLSELVSVYARMWSALIISEVRRGRSICSSSACVRHACIFVIRQASMMSSGHSPFVVYLRTT